jgi:hypothetical protein
MRSDKSAVSSITRDHSKVYIYHTVIRETEADKPNIRLTAFNLENSGNPIIWSNQYGSNKYADHARSLKSFNGGFIMLGFDESLDYKKNLRGLNTVFNHMTIADSAGNSHCMQAVAPFLWISDNELSSEMTEMSIDSFAVIDYYLSSTFQIESVVPFNIRYCGSSLSNGPDLETNPETHLHFCPNPFTEEARLELVGHDVKITIVEIFSAKGEMVRRVEGVNSNLLIIKREDLTSGIYFIKIWSDQYGLQQIKISIY